MPPCLLTSPLKGLPAESAGASPGSLDGCGGMRAQLGRRHGRHHHNQLGPKQPVAEEESALMGSQDGSLGYVTPVAVKQNER